MLNVSVIDSDMEFCLHQQKAINSFGQHNCKSIFSNCDEAIRKLPKEKPDVILMNIDFPYGKIPGPCAVEMLFEKIPDVKIIVLTDNQDVDCFFELFNIGISGFITRHHKACFLSAVIMLASENIVCVSREIVLQLTTKNNTGNDQCPVHLTDKQLVILHYLIEGQSYEQIACSQGISLNTVKKQIDRIYRALNVHNKLDAIKMGKQLGIL